MNAERVGRRWRFGFCAIAAVLVVPAMLRSDAIAAPLAPRLEEPRYAFPPLVGKPWKDVFEWLSLTTGKPVLAPTIPHGTFVAFVCKPGKRYTISDVADIINGSLLASEDTQKYLLIRRERDFMLVPFDKHIVCWASPISIEALPRQPRTQMVRVEIPLTELKAELVRDEFAKLLTPFGRLDRVKPNGLVIVERAGNVEQILEMIRLSENEAQPRSGK
jgi:hypothetical protein